jgi:hypothetical protein
MVKEVSFEVMLEGIKRGTDPYVKRKMIPKIGCTVTKRTSDKFRGDGGKC